MFRRSEFDCLDCTSPAFSLPARSLALAAMASLVVAGASPRAVAEGRPVYETFLATTTGMSPEGITLRLVVREWPDDQARADVVEALADSDGVPAALAELPSIGVVWRSGSGVGHALKYAHREQTESGQQRVTFVTEKPIDSYSFRKWEVPGRASEQALDYTVIELLLDQNGSGTGTLSLAADVSMDAESGEILLVRDAGAPVVLTDARKQPKPYWARPDSEG